MAPTSDNKYSDYIKQMGEHINTLYDRFKKIESKMDEIEKEVTSIKDAIIDDRKTFNEFIDGVTASLKEVLLLSKDELKLSSDEQDVF